jgi:diguanylate cyclase (GGDEF)-like protein/PAS domain S-box-containing protein
VSDAATSVGLLSSIIHAQREIMALGPDLVRIMHLVAEHAQALTQATGSAVELREGDDMVYRGVSGSVLTALGLRLNVHTSLSGMCVRSGESLCCEDSELDERVDREACRRVGVRSMLVVPLHSRGQVVGVLKVLSTEPRCFTRDHLATLEIMAGFIAEAMAHAAAHEESQRAAALFEGAFRHAATGMALVARNGEFVRVNDALCEIVGYSREDLLALNMLALTNTHGVGEDLEQLGRLEAREIEAYELEKRTTHRQGHWIWLHVTITAARDAQGGVLHYVAQVQDITRRKLAESEALAFFELSPDLLAIATQREQLAEVNEAWERTLGFTRQELTGQPLLTFIHTDDHARTLELMEGVGTGGAVRNFRNRFRTRDGNYRWLEWNTRMFKDGRHYCCARDVTEQVEHELALTELASLDGLTGLPNRRTCMSAVERALSEERQRGGSLACVLLDIDHFKGINDAWGHAAGDEVLRRFSGLLRGCLREQDLLGRWGGEEFAVFLRGKSSADFVSVAERIRRTCSDTAMVPDDPEYRVSVSIGLAELTSADRNPEQLLQRADQALYIAKNTGRNRVCLSMPPLSAVDA